MDDLISRQAAIDAIAKMMPKSYTPDGSHPADEEIFRAQEIFTDCIETLEILPSAQPEQRYTEEELSVFAHGISLSLLSKRSAQHWRYDEDTATEIKFLERLYEKVVTDMRGEQDETHSG